MNLDRYIGARSGISRDNTSNRALCPDNDKERQRCLPRLKASKVDVPSVFTSMEAFHRKLTEELKEKVPKASPVGMQKPRRIRTKDRAVPVTTWCRSSNMETTWCRSSAPDTARIQCDAPSTSGDGRKTKRMSKGRRQRRTSSCTASSNGSRCEHVRTRRCISMTLKSHPAPLEVKGGRRFSSPARRPFPASLTRKHSSGRSHCTTP